MKKLLFIFILTTSFAFSQTKVKDTVTRKATIGYDKKGNQVSLKPQTPPLNQVAGAPPASYSYFWEFGDGSYSKAKEPKKVYKKKGEYKVNLVVTNNYDNGKPPTTRPKTVAVTEITDDKSDEIASIETEGGFKVLNNREPVPDDEITVILSYENLLDYVASGKLYLFYNDKEFKKKNFDLVETRTHFGEKEIQENGIAVVDDKNNSYQNVASETNYLPLRFSKEDEDDQNLELTLAESKSLFTDSKVLEFDNMNAKETRNVFFTFKTTPEMLKDTSAVVKMRGVYVPDRNYKNHKKKTLEMEIVTSHDPNKMSSNATLINYRLVRFKTTNFKTRFQNDGKGPAKTIRLETDIPEMFDKKTLQIVDCYPKCPICPKGENVTYSCIDTIIKKDQIHFTFKNIYLPGSNQKNVTERDSTKGFVKYSLKFGKDFHKIKTKSKTSIFFDKNDPVITNYATTRFKMGISIGAKAGYNLYPNLNNSQSYFVAATICPYKSYRWYWQVELQNSLQKYDSGKPIITDRQVDLSTPPNGIFQLERTYSKYSFENVNLAIPILARYNINNFIGIGAGIQGNVNISQKETFENTVVLYDSTTVNPAAITSTSQNATNESKSLQNFNGGLLLDATIGFARIGPSLGARYVMNSQKNYNYWQFYAIWKF
ncbi:MAG: outer membrane beta-barrel protein [Flavobacteriaceae bacterium]|nr:outer membrane beta-barrel protein [Flavobacteriaceae bacterium]